MKKAIVLFAIATGFSVSIPSADILQGVVTSATDSSGLGQVKVSSDSAHFTFTATDGSFTLNTTVVTAILPVMFGTRFDVQWQPREEAFSWNSHSTPVSVEVRDTEGIRVAQSLSRACCVDSKFSAAGLPKGIHFVTFRTAGQSITMKVLNLGRGQGGYSVSEVSGGAAVSAPLRKSAATDTLIFSKAGYTQVTKILNGSQTGVAVQMQPASKIKYVFVIAMENTDATSIYGNRTNAPYINDTLVANYARGTNFGDELPLSIVSEPHYIWMEAGTNAFTDHTFTDDSDPTATISTSSTAHLSTQIRNAGNGTAWMSYQEDMNATTGACPIASSGFYAPKHDPFVFFQDVIGNPPSKTNSYCAAHHKPITALPVDLSGNNVASYNFITPNLCNDMHGQTGCPSGTVATANIQAGDTWLRTNLPPLINFVNANSGVIFLTWDEGSATSQMAFLVIGPNVKKGYNSTIAYNHGSMLKSVERILQLPILPTVASQTDFADFFTTGNYP